MGARYLVDTNVVIEFLGNKIPTKGSNWLENIIEQNGHCLSVINQIELLGFGGNLQGEMAIVKSFVQESKILSLSNSVVEKTIELRIRHKIKLPDAIIAATALTHNLQLITRNISDFRKIKGLSCIDAHKISALKS